MNDMILLLLLSNVRMISEKNFPNDITDINLTQARKRMMLPTISKLFFAETPLYTISRSLYMPL